MGLANLIKNGASGGVATATPATIATVHHAPLPSVATVAASPPQAITEHLSEKKLSGNWRPTPRAWIQDGELRTVGVFPDLAAEIIRLTGNNLELQRRLLAEHCQLVVSRPD
jgi:hypothetical protein